jgi:hypothetical protein
VIDSTSNEKKAMVAGGAMGGEYLEYLGKEEIASGLSPVEWDMFIESVITGYVDTLAELSMAENASPAELKAAVEGAQK